MSRPTYEVTKRYRDKAIKRVSVDLRKELVDAWEAKLDAEGIAKAAFIREAIEKYLQTKDA